MPDPETFALFAAACLAFLAIPGPSVFYIGIKRLLTAGAREAAPEPDDRATMTRLFWQGVIVNVLNPKTALFFLAFLPQFVDPDAGAVAPQMLVLGTLLVGLGVLSDGAYALVAAGAGRRLRDAARSRRALDRLSGGVFIGLGLVAALAGEPRQKS